MKKEELMNLAKEAQANAYAPYSNFKVGAALLLNDGNVIKGCNVENKILVIIFIKNQHKGVYCENF